MSKKFSLTVLGIELLCSLALIIPGFDLGKVVIIPDRSHYMSSGCGDVEMYHQEEYPEFVTTASQE